MTNPAEFVLPLNPSAIMAIADYLGLDRLFQSGIEHIHELVRRSSGRNEGTLRMISSMSDPARQRLLDSVEPSIFEYLRGSIAPYRHQYRSVVQRLLHSNHFARSCTLQDAEETFYLLTRVQSNLSDQMRNGFCDLESLARIDKSLFSPDYRNLATLSRCTQCLKLYDLLRRQFVPTDMYHGVIDFAFSPQGALVLLRWDGRVNIYQGPEEVYSLKFGGSNDGLAVSEHCALTFSTVHPWLRSQFDPTASARLWNWASSKSVEQMPALSTSICACLSSDGTFVAYCEGGGEVRTSSVSRGSAHCSRVLPLPNATGRWENGDVLSLIVSDDESVLVAAYASIIRVWNVGDSVESSIYDLDVAHGETVGHAAVSSDGRLIALGSCEGHITLLSFSKTAKNALQEIGRTHAGMSVLHLDWSPDRKFFAVSSYSGVKVIEPRFSNIAAPGP